MTDRVCTLRRLLLLTSIPLLHSLLSSNSRFSSSATQLCLRKSCLQAKRNPFRRADGDSFHSPAESNHPSNKPPPSKSALFSSSASRGRKRNAVRSDGMPFHSLQREDVNAIRAVSLLGGLLSVLVTRDVWCAVSSVLLLNVFGSQPNSIGTLIRTIGVRLDLLTREVTKKKTMKNILDFFRAVNEASVLNKIPTNPKSKIRNIAVYDDFNYLIDDALETETLLHDPSYGIDEDNKNENENENVSEEVNNPEVSELKIKNIPENINGMDSNPTVIPRSYFEEENEHENKSHVPLESSLTDALENIPQNVPRVPAEPVSVSLSVIKATIEVQAAADAASARLKAWLVQQKGVEEEKKRKKREAQMEIQIEAQRVLDLPRRRAELMAHLSQFVSTIESDDLAVSTAEDVVKNEQYQQIGPLGSFSARAVETRVGSITDFISVLTAPGDNSLKQRYRQLAREFHPDSSRLNTPRQSTHHTHPISLSRSPLLHTSDQHGDQRVLDQHISDQNMSDKKVSDQLVTVRNSLMANLTGAYNYLSGTHSLSLDGHRLMSVESPWGTKYEGTMGQAFQKKKVLLSDAENEEDAGKEESEESKEPSNTLIKHENEDNKSNNDGMSEEMKNIPEEKNVPEVEVDFSTPYNSPEQERKWRNWGKNIDWSKVHVQGSDIYTRAQETHGREGREGREGSAAFTSKKSSNSGENRKKASPLPSYTSPTSSSTPSTSVLQMKEKESTKTVRDSDADTRTDGRTEVSVRAAYSIAAPKEKENQPSSSRVKSIEKIERRERSDKNGAVKKEKASAKGTVNAVMLVKEFQSSSNSGSSSRQDGDRANKGSNNADNYRDNEGNNDQQGDEEDGSYSLRSPIISPLAAQVLVPPSLPEGYYLWGGETRPGTVSNQFQNQGPGSGPSSFINCFKVSAGRTDAALNARYKSLSLSKPFNVDAKMDYVLSSSSSSLSSSISSSSALSSSSQAASAVSVSSAAPHRDSRASTSFSTSSSAATSSSSHLDSRSSAFTVPPPSSFSSSFHIPSTPYTQFTGLPFTSSLSSSSLSSFSRSFDTKARRLAEARDSQHWVEGVIMKAKGEEIKERMENSKYRSFSSYSSSPSSFGSEYRASYSYGDSRGARTMPSHSYSPSYYSFISSFSCS